MVSFKTRCFDLGRLNIKLSVVYGIISIVLIVGAIGIGVSLSCPGG